MPMQMIRHLLKQSDMTGHKLLYLLVTNATTGSVVKIHSTRIVITDNEDVAHTLTNDTKLADDNILYRDITVYQDIINANR